MTRSWAAILLFVSGCATGTEHRLAELPPRAAVLVAKDALPDPPYDTRAPKLNADGSAELNGLIWRSPRSPAGNVVGLDSAGEQPSSLRLRFAREGEGTRLIVDVARREGCLGDARDEPAEREVVRRVLEARERSAPPPAKR